MKLFLGDKPIKMGSYFHYNGVKYKLIGLETKPIANSDEYCIIMKTKVAENNKNDSNSNT